MIPSTACSVLIAGIFLLPAARLDADVALPPLFSDHMVLQAQKAAALWGRAGPGEKVTVEFQGKSRSVQADTRGSWNLRLDPVVAGGPYEMTVRGPNTIRLQDIFAGEVWLASGQSNMEMQLKGLHGQVDHADAEIAAANHPQIRMFLYDDTYSIFALPVPGRSPERRGRWQVCSPETAAHFSAVGYFFARELFQKLQTPVGIINASAGGTPIEAWTSFEAQQKVPELHPMLESWKKTLLDYDPVEAQHKAAEARTAWLAEVKSALAAGKTRPKAPLPFKNQLVKQPGGLFTGLIAPLIPYTVRGVIWYQGEANSLGPFEPLYGLQLQTLIQDWRQRWHDDFPFLWVQLPWFGPPQQEPVEDRGWGVRVRDGMRQTLALPHTAMAVTLDYGDSQQVHLPNKADFGHRLALLALHDVYGQPLAAWSGPIFKGAVRDGNRMVISFDHAEGLKASGGELAGFAIAGTDRKFVWATAKLDHDRVVAWSDEVKEPAAVRYAWAGHPRGNLVNAGGLPASPFRTDDWK